MRADHSEMLNFYQEGLRITHISHFAKGSDNGQMDSHSIRRQNLLQLIREVGSKAEIARRAGVSEAYLSQVTSEKTKRNLGSDVARRIEKAMRRKAGWMDVSHSGVEPAEGQRVSVVWVPVLTWAEAAHFGSVVMDRRPAMTIPTAATVAGRLLSPRCFALRVTGDSMVNPTGRPSYPAGCTIIVDPDRDAQNGDRVIVKVPGVDEPAFKVYTVDSGQTWLRALNPQYPTLPWKEGMAIVGVVVQTVIDE